MSIQNVTNLIPLSEITINPGVRQRKSEPPSPKNCFEFACSLAGSDSPGLLHNIGVTPEGVLLFGERRYTAFMLLHQGSTELSDEQNETLTALAKANPQLVKAYKNWTVIPGRIVKDADLISSAAIQFIENAGREELPWNDRAEAAWAVHKACLDALRQRNAARLEGSIPERWTDEQTANLLGLTKARFSQLTAPLRAIETAPAELKEKLQQVSKASATEGSAKAAVKAVLERHGETPTKGFSLRPTATIIPVERKVKVSTVSGESPIICADFTKWAPTYVGEPFNVLHIDFPYGVNFNKAGGMGTNQANHAVGTYDDSPEVYWQLLQSLVGNRHRLVAASAHVLFWFSQNFRRETEDFFAKNWPEAVVSKFMLVWHCSDNSGLLPTPREGRRTYETAMQLTIGDRPLAAQRAMSFSSPRNETKVHRSQKHIEVLTHFLTMYVDESSHVLDPTCGSGTSMVVAKRLKAKSILGLEIDPEMCKQAQKFYEENTR